MQLKQITIQINKEPIIKSIDMNINPGEIFVLMGPSGSGKTTFLKGIAGLLPMSNGQKIWENGKGTMGLVFQEPRLFPHLTVSENIAFGLRAKGIPAKERKALARNFLNKLQLESLENRYPHQLSGGQQQRVSLGRALILNPDLLLLDEPFASLDTTLREELIEWLYELQRKLGFSILWVTHFLDEALAVADRIGIMLAGSLDQVGTPSEIFQQPASEKVAQFLSLPNRFTKDQWHSLIKGEGKVPVKWTRGWIDPNQLQIITEEFSTSDDKENEPSCFIIGTVAKVKPKREGFFITATANNELLTINTIGWSHIPEIGEKITIKVPLKKIHWYSE